jgi:hypothetical protein
MTIEPVRNLGEQPLANIMKECGIEGKDMVNSSTEQITYKMVSRACKGRRLTENVKRKILNALINATKRHFKIEELFTGCAQQAPETHFKHKSGIYFEFPEGWSKLSKKEWRERKMGKDRTLITIMDKERHAGFSVIPVALNSEAQMVFAMMGNEVEARVAMYLESLHVAGPNRYQEYKLFSKDTELFAGLAMGELVFQGKNPGKTLKWYRILVLALPNTEEALIMFIFTAPMGKQDSFKEHFAFIESTWKWKD